MPKAPRFSGENALNLSQLHEDVAQLKADIGKAEYYQARILRLEYAQRLHRTEIAELRSTCIDLRTLLMEHDQMIEDAMSEDRYAVTDAGLELMGKGLTNVHEDQPPLPGAEDWGTTGPDPLRKRHNASDAADGEHPAPDPAPEPASRPNRRARR